MNDAPASGIPEPHDAQNQIINLPGRFKIAVCGRRFGKTVAAAIAAVNDCKLHANRNVWWISPVQNQSDRVEREIAYWLRDKVAQAKKAKNKKQNKDGEETELEEKIDDGALSWQHKISEHALICSNGSRIEFHSAHTRDRLRGAGLDLVVVDEAADVDEYVWKTVLKPMLLEKRGQAFIIGTPRGKSHWLHRVFLLGREGGAGSERGTYASIQFPTRANPWVPADDLEDYKLEMTPEQFKQEFEAEFIDGVNTIFAGVEKCVEGLALETGRRGARYITGIDLGQSVDFTAICSISCADQRVEGFARFNQMDWSVQEGLILEHLKRFPGPAIVDSTGNGRRIFELLRDQHKGYIEPFIFTAQSRADILGGLQLGISHRELRIADVPQLLEELHTFTYLNSPEDAQASPGGRRKMGVPSGLHDDCVMALAMAWFGLKKRSLWGISDGPVEFHKDGYFG